MSHQRQNWKMRTLLGRGHDKKEYYNNSDSQK
jgi:hypothetical protein